MNFPQGVVKILPTKLRTNNPRNKVRWTTETSSDQTFISVRLLCREQQTTQHKSHELDEQPAGVPVIICECVLTSKTCVGGLQCIQHSVKVRKLHSENWNITQRCLIWHLSVCYCKTFLCVFVVWGFGQQRCIQTHCPSLGLHRTWRVGGVGVGGVKQWLDVTQLSDQLPAVGCVCAALLNIIVFFFHELGFTLTDLLSNSIVF